MIFQSIVDNLITDTLDVSLPRFQPELVLCVTIVLMLLVRVFNWGQKIDPFYLAFAGSAVALWFALPVGGLGGLANVEPKEIFTGMLVYDTLTVYLRTLLMFFALVFIVLVRLTGLADKQDGQDFYTLLLGSTLGMCLMASANHLMTVFLAVEMASVPSYVMAGILKGRKRSGEAALKYAVYGAGAAGVMLYGISLLAGMVGTAHLPSIAGELAAMNIPGMIAAGEGTGHLMVLALAGLMIMVGLAFKLSAVPFHFWCPDVFEGAPAEVGAFLSVASKAAAMALLIRVALGVSVAPLPEPVADADGMSAVVVATTIGHEANDVSLIEADTMRVPAVSAAFQPAESEGGPLSPVRDFIVKLLAIIAMVTCTFGNLAAYGQTNIKRLLAYSTIAHAGYMLMAVTAAVYLADTDTVAAGDAVAAVLFYLGVYLFMNLGAFAIVAFLRGAMGSEEIDDYAGLVRSCPMTSVALVAIMFSLVGLPPLAGFVGKFAIFASLVNAGTPLLYTVLVVGGVNTVISLVYYLRVAKTVCMDPEPDTRGPVTMGMLPAAYVLLVSLPVLFYGIFPKDLMEWARQAGEQLFL